MQRFFSFWWLCARKAAKGNSAFANDWQWLLGYPAVAAGLWVLGLFYAEFSGAMQVTLATGAVGALAAAFIAFVITWVVAFVVRLFYEPVSLFHQQKERADKLDGTPIVKPRSLDKNLATLQERYLSERLPIERELLDYEVDGLRAINDVTLIFDGLTKSAGRLTNLMNRHARKIRFIKNSEKKRRAVSKLASDINCYSDEVEQYAAVFRALTPAMFEYTSQFVERSPQLPNEVYINFAKSVGGNVQSSADMIRTIGETQQIFLATFRGISADLNTASARVQSVIDLLIVEATNYRHACEELQSLVLKKLTPHDEPQNEEAAL
jgi:hypothetical protein